VASVKNNVESLFCDEHSFLAVGLNQQSDQDRWIKFLPNIPNPFSESTRLLIEAGADVKMEKATIVISDIMGRQIQTIPVGISPGMNAVEFKNSKNLSGIYFYSLCDKGHRICSGKMVIY
jgi:hypothetical protein